MNQHESEIKSTQELTNTLIQIMKELSEELHSGLLENNPITLNSSLDRDLGYDSLAKVELLSRIEKTFQVVLSEQTFTEADTPRDLLGAIMKADVRELPIQSVQMSDCQLEELDSLPHQSKTLNDVLKWHVTAHPDRLHLRFYSDEGKEESMTYKELWEHSTHIAAGLQHNGIEAGEPVAIMLPTEKNYFFSFFGILLAGGIPVPLYPPARLNQIEDHLKRQCSILNNCRAPLLITIPEAKRYVQLLKTQVDTLKDIVTVSDLSYGTDSFVPLNGDEQDLAFLQYTSGSTGMPKGVALTHANLIACVRTMGQSLQVNGDDVVVSWLPLYHDMGLIGAWLGSLYHGILLIIMSPLAFLRRPQRWLWAIHQYRGTISVAPNFAYEMCLKRINADLLEGLDLTSWRVAMNGAEPVSPKTISHFSEKYARYGFKKEIMMPVYGLAECSLGLAFPPVGRMPVIDRIKREPFLQSGQAIPEKEDVANVLEFVACGHALPAHDIRLLDKAGREVPERQVGKLQFRGPSATAGYYRNPEQTQNLLDGDWLNSGDLAYMADGDLFITGRNKDVIIRAGRNIYPHELEEAVGNVPGVRLGNVAVFGSKDESTGTEKLVVLAETKLKQPEALNQIKAKINSLGVDLLGSPPDDVVLLGPGVMLKTSSGKIRRSALRELYEKKQLDKSKTAPWLQLISFALSSIAPQLRRFQKYLLENGYSAYAWVVLTFLFPFVWLLMFVLPKASWRYQLIHKASSFVTKLAGLTPKVEGLENVPKETPHVMVSNHCSYIDFLMLTAALPSPMRFVAKSELASNAILRIFLNNVKTEFINRIDKQKGIEEAREIVRSVHHDWPVLIFPEGTFTRKTGLRPFQMGAFLAAAESNVCIVPISLKGTRSILRDQSWLLRQGTATVRIGLPISNDSAKQEAPDMWKTAIQLRNESRKYIMEYCGEADASHEKPLRF
ncbi:MAG: AMP-binding protein [SAR324 cluster bacterium]|nr:AMP-binding protein [SAR324 cluster bacterium]